MTEAFVIVICLLAIGLVVSTITLAMAMKDSGPMLRAAVADSAAASKAQLQTERNQIEAERQRDEVTVRLAATQASLDRAIEQLKDTQADALRARSELVRRVQEEMVGATPESALAAVNDLLGKAFPVVRGGQ
jgi:hypothetical protein